jgi:hypothetical protein
MFKLPPRAAGSTAIPPLGLGTYKIRIAILTPSGTQVANQQQLLRVFGKVPLGKLLTANSVRFVNDRVEAGTVTLPTATFSYVLKAASRPGLIVVRKANSECRSLHLDFTVPKAHSEILNPASSLTLSLTQESLDPASVTTTPDIVATFDAKLVPGESWSLSASNDANYPAVYFYANGYADCDGTKPFVS